MRERERGRVRPTSPPSVVREESVSRALAVNIVLSKVEALKIATLSENFGASKLHATSYFVNDILILSVV